MKTIINIISAATIILMFSSARAGDSIIVYDSWIRSAPPNAKVLAAYMYIMNESVEPRSLTAVSSSRFEKVEMHRTELHDGMIKMVSQKQLDIPAGGSLLLEPGGYHLMLIKPKSVPKAGDKVKLELYFDNGSILKVKASVRPGKKWQ